MRIAERTDTLGSYNSEIRPQHLPHRPSGDAWLIPPEWLTNEPSQVVKEVLWKRTFGIFADLDRTRAELYIRCYYILGSAIIFTAGDNSRFVIFIEFCLPETPIMLLHPKFPQILNLFRGQGERHGSQIIAQPFFLPTCRDRHHTLVDAPP